MPHNATSNKPVLVYIHGGGFNSGDKLWTESIYSNIGWFFAQNGVITVVANHQLVPYVKYPGGANDIQLLREWIAEKIAEERFGMGSKNKVVLFGHSSGGAHITMNLYAAGDIERPYRDPLDPPVAALILLDVPFWMDNRKPGRQKTLQSYYGSYDEEVWGPKSPLGLFQRLPDESPVLDSQRLPVYLGSVEWEVPETAEATVLFFNAYRARSRPYGSLPLLHVNKRHNHLRLGRLLIS